MPGYKGNRNQRKVGGRKPPAMRAEKQKLTRQQPKPMESGPPLKIPKLRLS